MEQGAVSVAQQQQRVRQLVESKDAMEQEIGELMANLTAPGMPGLTGGLVDREGFPLSDVDKLLSVRQARHRLACTRASSPPFSCSHLFSI